VSTGTHPRSPITRAARSDLMRMLDEFLRKHDLTYIECAQLFAEEVSSCLKFALRVERHGN
jgi:hypothetical protein